MVIGVQSTVSNMVRLGLHQEGVMAADTEDNWQADTPWQAEWYTIYRVQGHADGNAEKQHARITC